MNDSITAATRGYCELAEPKPLRSKRQRKRTPLPKLAFVFDCETTANDHTQRLTFGAWALYEKLADREEYASAPMMRGVFYANGPGAPSDNEARLREAVREIEAQEGCQLLVHSQSDFLEEFYKFAYQLRALVVGFNLPFDLARIARQAGAAKDQGRKAHSLLLWPKEKHGRIERSASGRLQQRAFRPAIVVRRLGPTKASLQFTRASNGNGAEVIGWARKLAARVRRGSVAAPWESKPAKELTFTERSAQRLVEAEKDEREAIETLILKEYLAYKPYKGRFLDLSTLARALTDRAYSLRSAAKAWNVTAKADPGGHPGFDFDSAYVKYCLQDVATTGELLGALLEEFHRHPIPLDADRAFSSASIGKAYLDAMGITPPLERWPDFPRDALGIAQSAFYGGRTSVRIRKAFVPVQYLDFLSDYPTVNALLGNIETLRAAEVSWEDCTAQTRELFASLDPEVLFDPTTWPKLNLFAEVTLDGSGLFPVRAAYDGDDADRLIGMVNARSERPAWYHGCDLAASIAMTGDRPTILRAYRVVPKRNAAGAAEGVPGLQAVRFAGYAEIDPAREDFFVRVIEQRQVAKSDPVLSAEGRKRFDKGLKVLANATAYGIYAEVNARDEGDVETVLVRNGGEPFEVITDAPELPGRYYFAPLATSITAGARLLLAMLEREVTSRGGCYALEDTDSCAIVATRLGGRAPVPNGPLPWNDNDRASYAGPHRDAETSVHALSFAEVDEITARFAGLSPYSRSIVSGSILKLEDVNMRPDGSRRQLWTYAVSSKRYALFEFDEEGRPNLRFETPGGAKLQYTESGLGGIVWPEGGGIEPLWRYLIEQNLGLDPESPAWLSQPVVTKFPLSSQETLKAFVDHDMGQPYELSAKPYGFGLTARLASGMNSCDTSLTDEAWRLLVARKAEQLRSYAEGNREPYVTALDAIGGRMVVPLLDGTLDRRFDGVKGRYTRVDRDCPEGTFDAFIKALEARLPGVTADDTFAFLRGEVAPPMSRAQATRSAEQLLLAKRPKPGVVSDWTPRPRLFAPLCDSSEWLEKGAAAPWFDMRTGGRVVLSTEHGSSARVSPGGYTPSGDEAREAKGQCFASLISEYDLHPEAKSATASGAPCGYAEEDYRGPLYRRSVTIDGVSIIGKESSAFENAVAQAFNVDEQDEGSAVLRAAGSGRSPLAEQLTELSLKEVAREARTPIELVRAVRDNKTVATTVSVGRVTFAAKLLGRDPTYRKPRTERRKRWEQRAIESAARDHYEQRVEEEIAWWRALDDVGGTIVPDLDRVRRSWRVASEFRPLPQRHRVTWDAPASRLKARGNLDELVTALRARGVRDATRTTAIAFFAEKHRPTLAESRRAILANPPVVSAQRRRKSR